MGSSSFLSTTTHDDNAIANHSSNGIHQDRAQRQRRRPKQGTQNRGTRCQAAYQQIQGKASKRTQFVREIVKEVSGLAPYERRVIELLRNSKDKRARKLAKKRLGTFGRAKAKVEELTNVIAESRRAGH